MRTIRKKIDALKAKRKAPKQTSEDVQGPTRKSASPKPAPTKERTVVTAREIQADEGEQEQTSDVPQVQEVQQIREPRIMDFGQSLSPSTPTTLSVDFNFEQHSLEIARAELKDVSEAFDTNYHKFLSRHATLVTFDAEVKGALNTSHSEANIQVSAKLFRHQLNKVSQSYARSKEHLNWHKKVGNFVASLYPVVRLTLGVTSDVAGSTGFLPLQVGANGLALIFQLLDEEKSRKENFLKNLAEIENQFSRITSNKHFEAMFQKILLQERATRLMVGIIHYLNSALSYLCRDSIMNAVHSLFGASAHYREAEEKLVNAIRRYSEAVGDFTAECVAADRELRIADIKEHHDLEFIEWISSSQWDVEAQLQLLRGRYRETPTLRWAHKTDYFQLWLRSDLAHDCKERVLWVVGPPGVGKSTLAAYLVEFTRALDASAITAFFFVRSELGGLASPVKVLCTLAHQLSLLVPNFRQSLEQLRMDGFVVKDELGISYLFEKLILEPLSSCRRPIYVIVDGVDEVDLKKDPRDPYRDSSQILFDCLYRMPSSRILFLSRPQTVPSPPKHPFVVQHMGLDQNKVDIEAYVNQQLSENPRLKTRFEKAEVDPLEFFLAHSNGIFLWVVLVLKHLSTVSGKLFTSFVRGITDTTPTDMRELYEKILDRFSKEDREWIKEIFYWIIGPKRHLSLQELQCAVEFCLQDELEDFRDFVLRKCGSLFVVTGHGNTNDSFVQTVHETLRAFIMNPNCPQDLHVTLESAHTHITYRGLSFLSAEDTQTEPLYRYLIAEWHYHLVNTTLRNHDQDILCGLYRFFHSSDLKKWVHDDILSHWASEDTENETPIERKGLRDVQRWLARFKMDGETESLKRSEDSAVLQKAIIWRDEVVRNIDKLGESVGKAAALIWLFDEVESKKTIIAAFKLGTGYYWTRENRGDLNDREELQELFDTEFAGLIEWAGGVKGEMLNDRNLTIARVTLTQWLESYTLKQEIANKSNKQLWEDIHEFHCPLHRRVSQPAVVSYSPDSDNTARDWLILTSQTAEVTGSSNMLEALQIQVKTDPIAWVPLGTAHRAAGNVDKAIIAYKQAIKARPYNFAAHEMLAEMYRVIGEYKKSVQIFEGCIQQGFDEETLVGFGWSYLPFDETKAIDSFTRAMKSNPDFAPAYKGLGDLYNVRDDPQKMIEIYRNALETSPTTSFLWSGLGEAYLAKEMQQDAIDAYETAVKVNPRDRWAWACLGDAYRQDKQYDKAIDAFWHSIEGNPRDSWPWKGLAESYRENGDTTRAIAIYTHALRRLRDYSIYISVSLLFRERGNYDKAIRNITEVVACAPLKRRFLYAYTTLPTSHLFSNYPLIGLDDNLPKSLLWTHVVDCIRAHQDSLDSKSQDVEQHMDKEIESAESIIEEAIGIYAKALKAHNRNRLLWIYSAYSASRGFPPFEQKHDLPRQILLAMLAEAHKAAGQHKEAAAAYDEAIKILSDNKWLWTSLSETYEKCGDVQKAAEARATAEKVTGVYQIRFYPSHST